MSTDGRNKSYPLISALTWIRRGLLRYLSTPGLRVFNALCVHFNKDNLEYAKVETIAELADVSEGVTHCGLKELLGLGVIAHRGYTRFTKTNKRATAIYELLPCDNAAQLALSRQPRRRKRGRPPSPKVGRESLGPSSASSPKVIDTKIGPSPKVIGRLSPKVGRESVLVSKRELIP